MVFIVPLWRALAAGVQPTKSGLLPVAMQVTPRKLPIGSVAVTPVMASGL